MAHEWQRDAYLISTDKPRLNLAAIHGFLTTVYWSPGLPRSILERAIEHSLVLGLYQDQEQVGFARVITDFSTMAYLCDVFILEPFKGQGLGLWLIETIVSHPDLQGLRRFMLATRDAHGLYGKAGFVPLNAPERWMEIWNPNVYASTQGNDSRR